MSIRNDRERGFIIVCDPCGRDGATMQTASGAEKIAERDGWKKIGISRREKTAHVCPGCYEEWPASLKLADFVKWKRRSADNNNRG